MPTGAQNVYVLQTDANGIGSWQPVSASISDADWFDIANPGNAPASINDNIYTLGNVAIGGSTFPSKGKLEIWNYNSLSSGASNEHGLYIHGSNPGSNPSVIHSKNIGTVMNGVSGGESYGLYVQGSNIASNTDNAFGVKTFVGMGQNSNYGGYFYTFSSVGNTNVGVWGHSYSSGETSIGVKARVDVTGNPTPTSKRYGVFSEAIIYGGTGSFPGEVYGVYSDIRGGRDAHNIYGVYSTSSSSSTSGITPGGNPTSFLAGYFNGDVEVVGTYWTASDRMLKKDIKDIYSANEIIKKINPKSYNFKIEEFPYMNLSTGEHFGVIAQEFKEVLPNLVRTVRNPAVIDTTGEVIKEAFEFESVNYMDLIPLLIASQKEMLTEIENLKASINSEPQNPVKKHVPVFRLDQNNPNPFGSETEINYMIEEDGITDIYVYSLDGRLVKSYRNIPNKGNVFFDNNGLSAGVYTYALFFNGNELASKKMVID